MQPLSRLSLFDLMMFFVGEIYIYIYINMCFVFWLLFLPCKRLLFFGAISVFFICQVIT